jgi:hypothetical protein
MAAAGKCHDGAAKNGRGNKKANRAKFRSYRMQ